MCRGIETQLRGVKNLNKLISQDIRINIARLVNILIQIVQMYIIFTHLKLWAAAAMEDTISKLFIFV